jgi:hypothetical protein
LVLLQSFPGPALPLNLLLFAFYYDRQALIKFTKFRDRWPVFYPDGALHRLSESGTLIGINHYFILILRHGRSPDSASVDKRCKLPEIFIFRPD